MSMKKLICLFMMCWLPLSITAAQAMSAQMMLNHFNSKTQQLVPATKEMTSAQSMPCHQFMQTNKAEKAPVSICADCAACELATAFATIDLLVDVTLPKKIADKFTISQSSLISTQLPPSIKPPILH